MLACVSATYRPSPPPTHSGVPKVKVATLRQCNAVLEERGRGGGGGGGREAKKDCAGGTALVRLRCHNQNEDTQKCDNSTCCPHPL